MSRTAKRIIVILLVLLLAVLGSLLVTKTLLNKRAEDVSQDVETITGTIDDGSNGELEIKADDPVSIATENNEINKEAQEVLELSSGIYTESLPFKIDNVLPGDVINKTYELDVYHSDRVLLKFMVTPVNESILFDVLNIEVLANDILLYEGLIADLPDHLNMFVESNVDKIFYEVKISLPTSAGNEYQRRHAIIDLHWEVDEEYQKFMVPNTSVSGFVDRAENFIGTYGGVLFGTGLIVIYFVILGRKKNEDVK